MLALFPHSAALEGASLAIGGLTAEALAEEHGTPLVVLCEETVRANARALRAALGHDGVVFFGTKAFPNVALLRTLHEEGVGADVASERGAECARVRAHCLLAQHDERRSVLLGEGLGRESADRERSAFESGGMREQR